MLILAGVSLNLVLGENGIISKAKEAKSETERDIIETQTLINSLYDELAGNLDGEGSGNLPSTDYTTPYLPSSSFTQVTGTDLSSGLVIQDSNGNQYVWVEVPRTATVYPNAGTTLDLETLTGTELETAYNNAKKAMLKSVYENGGFYVGRYETGIAYDDTNSYRTAKGDTTQTPVIKANAYPYNYVTRTQAKVLADNMES